MYKSNLSILLAILVVSINISFAADNYNKIKADETYANWTGKKVGGQHNGTINISDANLVFNGDKLTGGSAKVDLNSIVCLDLDAEEWNKKLVGHLKSDDFFDVKNHPSAKFKIKSAKKVSNYKYEITADVTIRGTTHENKFTAEIVKLNDKVVASAYVTVDRAKYGMKFNSGSFFENLGDKLVYDDFYLDIKLVVSK